MGTTSSTSGGRNEKEKQRKEERDKWAFSMISCLWRPLVPRGEKRRDIRTRHIRTAGKVERVVMTGGAVPEVEVVRWNGAVPEAQAAPAAQALEVLVGLVDLVVDPAGEVENL